MSVAIAEKVNTTQDPSHAPHAGPKILLVEDDPGNQTFLRVLIEYSGYDCIVVQNGKETQAQLAREKFSLILMDLKLPDIDGYELSRQARRCPLNYATPLVGISANTGREVKQRCLDAGMDDLYSKSMAPSTLLSLLQKHIPT